jgi:heme A synthase
MKTLRPTIRMSIVATLLLATLTANVHGDIVGGGSQGFGPGGDRAIKIRGNVVCANCNLEEMRQTNPREYPFYYQFTHRNGRLVMHVNWVSDTARWTRVAWPPQLWVRAEERVLQQLGAEANLFKEMEITGTLGSSRTLDIVEITISG